MEPQPDVKKLAKAFTTSFTALATASHEIALVSNIPTFNDGQRIYDAIERLSRNVDAISRNMDAISRNMDAGFNSFSTELASLRVDMNSKFDNLELRMRAESAYILPIINLHHDDILQFGEPYGQAI